MIRLVIGRPACGKSAVAEEMVLRGSAPTQRIYLATMVPYGEEGARRVERHRKMREGKHFLTLEIPRDITGALERMERPREKVVLLECLANLAANELFAEEEALPVSTRTERLRARRAQLAPKIEEEIRQLAREVKELVVVASCYDPAEGDDEETRIYIALMDELNHALREMAEEVVEVGAQEGARKEKAGTPERDAPAGKEAVGAKVPKRKED